MMSSRKKTFIAIHDGRPFFSYTRAVRSFDADKQLDIDLYPPFVYDNAQWQEHWEDIVGYDDPDHPYRLKDLIHFNRPEDIHPDFMQETTRQLTPIINRRVGIELQKLEVMIEFGTGCTYCVGDYVYTYMDIVSYGNGNRFWIKWKSLIPGQKYIPMSQSVTAEDICFDICRTKEIPQIRERESPAFDMNVWVKSVREVILEVKPPKNNYSFDFQIAGLSWPDAHFDLVFSDALSDDAIQAMNERIGNFVNGWNEQEEQNGQEDFIHNMLDMRRTDEKSCEVLIDFGSASELSLLKFLGFLQEIGGDKLTTVVLS